MNLKSKPNVPFRVTMRSLGNIALFGLAFLVAYRYGMSFTQDFAAPFWLPDSVLLCALLVSLRSTWWLYILVILPIRFFLFVPAGTPFWFLVTCFGNDSLKALLSALLLRRKSDDHVWFDSIREFTRYLLIAVALSPALSAVAGAATRTALGDGFWTAWQHWFFGDALASLVLTPLLVCLVRDYQQFLRQPPSRYLKALLILAGLVLTAYVVFDWGLEGSGRAGRFAFVANPP